MTSSPLPTSSIARRTAHSPRSRICAHEVRVMGDVAGRRLTQALRRRARGIESPEETRLRLVITRNGLPEPELNWDLRDAGGRLIARLRPGLPVPSRAVWSTTAGFTPMMYRQFEADADRWSAIARAGWTHVRVLRHHMRADDRRARWTWCARRSSPPVGRAGHVTSRRCPTCCRLRPSKQQQSGHAHATRMPHPRRADAAAAASPVTLALAPPRPQPKSAAASS